MARKKKTAVKTPVKKNGPLELIAQKKSAFIVGASALALGIVLGILLIPPRAEQKSKKMKDITIQKNMGYKEYTMQENENLWDVADRFYGNPYLYSRIAQENNIQNPDEISPGTKIRLYNLPRSR